MIMEKPFKVNKAANVRNLDDIRFPVVASPKIVGYRHPVFLGFRHEDDIDNKF